MSNENKKHTPSSNVILWAAADRDFKLRIAAAQINAILTKKWDLRCQYNPGRGFLVSAHDDPADAAEFGKCFAIGRHSLGARAGGWEGNDYRESTAGTDVAVLSGCGEKIRTSFMPDALNTRAWELAVAWLEDSNPAQFSTSDQDEIECFRQLRQLVGEGVNPTRVPHVRFYPAGDRIDHPWGACRSGMPYPVKQAFMQALLMTPADTLPKGWAPAQGKTHRDPTYNEEHFLDSLINRVYLQHIQGASDIHEPFIRDTIAVCGTPKQQERLTRLERLRPRTIAAFHARSLIYKEGQRRAGAARERREAKQLKAREQAELKRAQDIQRNAEAQASLLRQRWENTLTPPAREKYAPPTPESDLAPPF